MDDSPSTQLREARKVTRGIAWILVSLTVLAAFALLFRLLENDPRTLKRLRPLATVEAMITEGSPSVVGFGELNDAPGLYRNVRIQVSGMYHPLSLPDCEHHWKGPKIRWTLLAEDLEMNAVGFEVPLRRVAPGTTLTVVGVWRLYEGPVGCGRIIPVTSVWYLQVEQILSPNPLVGQPESAGTGSTLPSSPGSDLVPPSPTGDSVPAGNATPALTPEATSTLPFNVTLTATPATPFVTVSVTLTPATSSPGGTFTPTAAGSTPTITPGGTLNPTSTATAAAGSTPQGTPTDRPTNTPFPTSPPLATATPGSAYPGPATPEATPSPGSYP